MTQPRGVALSVERCNEVENLKGAGWSRERTAESWAIRTLGCQRQGFAAGPEKHERGASALTKRVDRTGQKASAREKPKGAYVAEIWLNPKPANVLCAA